MEETRAYYQEAIRYIDMAKDLLAESPIKDGHYTDIKQIKCAALTAHIGVITVTTWALKLKNKKMPIDGDENEIIRFIERELEKTDQKILEKFMHLVKRFNVEMRYKNLTDVNVIQVSFVQAKELIVDLIRTIEGCSLSASTLLVKEK